MQFADTNQFSDSNKDDVLHAIGIFIAKSPGVHRESFQQTADKMKSTKARIKNWILLDTGSLTDIFCDPNLLGGVSKDPRGLVLHTNGGILECDQKGEFTKYGKVWHDCWALTNIFSFYNLQSKFNMTIEMATTDSISIPRMGRRFCLVPAKLVFIVMTITRTISVLPRLLPRMKTTFQNGRLSRRVQQGSSIMQLEPCPSKIFAHSSDPI